MARPFFLTGQYPHRRASTLVDMLKVITPCAEDRSGHKRLDKHRHENFIWILISNEVHYLPISRFIFDHVIHRIAKYEFKTIKFTKLQRCGFQLKA